MDEAGNTTFISFNEEDYPLFNWQCHPKARVARRTSYGGKDSGEVYWDLDCDGQYDMKFVLDSNGNREARYIFMDSAWKPVDKGDFENGVAVSGRERFVFEAGTGWFALDAGQEYEPVEEAEMGSALYFRKSKG